MLSYHSFLTHIAAIIQSHILNDPLPTHTHFHIHNFIMSSHVQNVAIVGVCNASPALQLKLIHHRQPAVWAARSPRHSSRPASTTSQL